MANATGGVTDVSTQIADMKKMAQDNALMMKGAQEAKKITSDAEIMKGVSDQIANSKSKIGQQLGQK